LDAFPGFKINSAWCTFRGNKINKTHHYIPVRVKETNDRFYLRQHDTSAALRPQ
jgi:hypothetical protein